ncbi:unnamed protein product [Musa acuminata subsp. malaccensis]|uniref:(wild Malaysian banana) hypothetical protein n=1 Tax=Musa acuminata subsp. malaccensis TaxID=214687 RepID=A0A804JK76_MUSAM|nr:unnamed protein product [Musa acuminata subsp. malaccensis]
MKNAYLFHLEKKGILLPAELPLVKLKFSMISARILRALGASLSSTLARSTRSTPWRCKRRGSHSCSRSPPPTAASCGLTVPLKIMCSRKCVVPASVLTPTVAVRVAREDSVATRRPLGRVMIMGRGAGRMGLWPAVAGCGEA